MQPLAQRLSQQCTASEWMLPRISYYRRMCLPAGNSQPDLQINQKTKWSNLWEFKPTHPATHPFPFSNQTGSVQPSWAHTDCRGNMHSNQHMLNSNRHCERKKAARQHVERFLQLVNRVRLQGVVWWRVLWPNKRQMCIFNVLSIFTSAFLIHQTLFDVRHSISLFSY